MKNLLQIKCLTLICLLFSFFINGVQGQVDIGNEKISEKCKGVPLNERIRVTVSRFDVTTNSYKAKKELGGEMATMLTNALQNVNCFQVLESISNFSDLTDEMDLQNSEYLNKSSVAQKGNMLGAQAIVTGEITEYHEGEGSIGLLGLKMANNKVRIGFILKVLDAETRTILWSDSFDSEMKTPGKFNGFKFGSLNLAGGNRANSPRGEAVERGAIKAVYKLVKEMDNIEFPEVDRTDYRNTTMTKLIVQNVTSYGKVMDLSELLKSESSLKDVKKGEFNIEENLAFFNIRHEGDKDEFLVRLYALSKQNNFIISNNNQEGIEITLN